MGVQFGSEYAPPGNTRLIALKLKDERIKNRDTEWSKSSVGALLRNHSVCGCVVFGRRARGAGRVKQPREKWIVVQSYEAIIDSEDFEKVQQLMDKATNPSEGSPKSTHAFTGILRCEETDCTMQIETAKSGKYHYYNCRNAQKYGIGKGRRIRADLFDEWLTGVILDRILTEDFLADILAEINEVCGRCSIDHRQRRKAAQQLSKWHPEKTARYLSSLNNLDVIPQTLVI
jgi:site-specific DNA recombinase